MTVATAISKDRRRDVRYLSGTDLVLCIIGSHRSVDAAALDCSSEGICFETLHDIQVGQIIHVRRLTCPPDCPSIGLCSGTTSSGYAEVKWRTEIKTGDRVRFRAGAAYLQ